MRQHIKKILKEQVETNFLKMIIVDYFIKTNIPISQLVTAAIITPNLNLKEPGSFKFSLETEMNPKGDKHRKLNLDRKKISADLKFDTKEQNLFDELTDDEIIVSYGETINYPLKKVKDLLILLDYEGKPVMFYENNQFTLTQPNMNFGDWTSARGYVWVLGDKYPLQITNLSNLNHTSGNFGIYDVNLENFGGFSEHNGNLTISHSKIENWDTLKKITGNLTIYETTKINSLQSLLYVGGNLKIIGDVHDTGNLSYVGGDLVLNNNQTLTSLGKIKYVGGRLRIRNSQINDLGNLVEVPKGALISKDTSPDLILQLQERGIKFKKG